MVAFGCNRRPVSEVCGAVEDSGSGQLAGVDPTCLASQVAHAVAGHRIAFGGLQLIQDLLAGLCELGTGDERIGGWVSTADLVQRSVLLRGQNSAFNRLTADRVAQVVGSQTDTFFLAWASVVDRSGEGRCSGCSKAGGEDSGTNFHDGLL